MGRRNHRRTSQPNGGSGGDGNFAGNHQSAATSSPTLWNTLDTAAPGNKARKASSACNRSAGSDNGAVGEFDLGPAETVIESNSILEAARQMVAKRLDFLLVVDEGGELAGIVTDRDLAYRVIALEDDEVAATGAPPINLRTCPIKEIMTANPLCTTADCSMISALSTMVQRHFRHLPVLRDTGSRAGVLGVLDIAKCFYDAMLKLELADAAAHQIAATIANVNREVGSLLVAAASANATTASGCSAITSSEALVTLADSIREQLACPKLSSVLLSTRSSADQRENAKCGVVTVQASVTDAVKLMRRRKETAVLVVDDLAKSTLVGIFTTKDVLLRVVATEKDPNATSVANVMTPHPDTVAPDMSIASALRKMHNGHYLHLPVIDSVGKRIVGIADILQLTYSMLEQLSVLTGQDSTPLWHQLWSSSAKRGSSGESGEDLSWSGPSKVFPPPPSSSLLDGNSFGGQTFFFKLKYESSSVLVPVENAIANLPSLRDLEGEAQGRFGLTRASLRLVDEEGDAVPIKDEVEFRQFIRAIQAKGADRAILVVGCGSVNEHHRRLSRQGSSNFPDDFKGHPKPLFDDKRLLLGMAAFTAGLTAFWVYLVRRP